MPAAGQGERQEFLSDAVLPAVPAKGGTEPAKLAETRNFLLSVDRVSL